jgi:beta-glucosidase-like glycosyl hydrolase
LQGGLENTDHKQIIATCKHYAVYDVETNRNGQNYDPTQQDLGEYYLQPFKTCVRDVNVGSIMCSYNAVDGVPACASEYLLQDVLRDEWGFTEPYRYVTSDCAAVQNIWTPHNFTDSEAAAAAVALNAGTDTNCGSSYLLLNESVANGWTTEAQMDKSLTRLYNALFTVGYFDGQPQYDGGFPVCHKITLILITRRPLLQGRQHTQCTGSGLSSFLGRHDTAEERWNPATEKVLQVCGIGGSVGQCDWSDARQLPRYAMS